MIVKFRLLHHEFSSRMENKSQRREPSPAASPAQPFGVLPPATPTACHCDGSRAVALQGSMGQKKPCIKWAAVKEFALRYDSETLLLDIRSYYGNLK